MSAPNYSAARIRHMQDRFDALGSQIAEAYAGVPVNEDQAEIDAAMAAERSRVAGNDTTSRDTDGCAAKSTRT